MKNNRPLFKNCPILNLEGCKQTKQRKQTKQTKQRKQTKQTKQRKQTKHKRRMQYGGKKYEYVDYSRILTEKTPKKNVVMPGYPEICDMMKEYKDYENIQRQLDAAIKTKDVVLYASCNTPNADTPPATIILMRKDDFFFNNSIDCDDKTYLTLASHNFQIFIKDILKWNPFLSPNGYEKEEEVHQIYGSRHKYNSENFSYMFTQESWWNSQEWWNEYKRTLPIRASILPATQPHSRAFTPIQEPQPIHDKDATIRVLEIQIIGLNKEVIALKEENQTLREQITRLTSGET
jgi:hypothetical protein